MEELKKSPAEKWQGLMAAKEIINLAKLSRAHLYSMLARSQFPQPAIRVGSRFTRWKACDVQAWLSDPEGWIKTHSKGMP